MSLVSRLVARAKRTPYHHLPGYMNRWWLVPYPESGSASSTGCGPVSWRRPVARLLQLCGVAVRVHEILRSDLGRDPHDHPWSFMSIILKGHYVEDRYDAKGDWIGGTHRGPGSIAFRRAKDLHKLTLPPATTVTTLFITGPSWNSWGFQTRAGKVGHKEYRGSR